ncbi:MFS transporter [Desulforamulus aeronauticus]|uniref:Predicted arabinose efflux permease, MFS family n=1 Tax=Desulforamulus aeronauticus DSM 10349 TaxID=1121421 RepID=A0A1M6QV36_9FIRM|nr:MFS transporter [Desulforamulus aeronauticus]SHK23927.1 Predicted arabinose efflux permease, MFS family [Desulforamulus aeronauticus DSM 10349]
MFKTLNITLREFIFILLLFVAELSRSAFFLTFWPLYAADILHFSTALAGAMVSAHYLSETLYKTFAGYQLDRFGRPVLAFGLLISLLSLVGLYQQPTGWLTVLLAAIFGLGFAPVWLAVISNVAPVDHPKRATKIGLVFSAWLLGAGAGPVGVTFLLPLGYEQTFLLLILLWGVALVIGLSIPFSAKTSSTSISISQQLKKLASDKMVIKVLLPGMFLQTMAASLLLPILPLYATKTLGLTSEQYGLLLTAGGAAAVLCLVPMGKLVDRLSLKKVLTTGFCLSAFFLCMLPFASDLRSLFAIVMLVGCSYALILPAWNTLLARAIPAEHQATGWGIFTTLEGLGIATGPLLGGAIANWLHPVGAIYLSAAILAGMGIFYLCYSFEGFYNTRSDKKCG